MKERYTITGAVEICEFLGAFVIGTPSRHCSVLLRSRHHRVGIGIVLEHRILVDLPFGFHRRQEIRCHRARGRRSRLAQVRYLYFIHYYYFAIIYRISADTRHFSLSPLSLLFKNRSCPVDGCPSTSRDPFSCFEKAALYSSVLVVYIPMLDLCVTVK